MIYNKTINGLKVFIKDNDPFYEQVLNDFLTCRVKTLKVFRSIDDTKVILIDTARGPLVLKVYAPKHKMIERFLKSCVKKDYYENLIIKPIGYVVKAFNQLMTIFCLLNVKH